jgi:hypothetical protein
MYPAAPMSAKLLTYWPIRLVDSGENNASSRQEALSRPGTGQSSLVAKLDATFTLHFGLGWRASALSGERRRQ